MVFELICLYCTELLLWALLVPGVRFGDPGMIVSLF